MIKSRPEDFAVDEILSPEASRRIAGPGGPFANFVLTKRGLATDEALDRVAASLGIPARRIAYAGLKDKHALTSQHISIDTRGAGARSNALVAAGRGRAPAAWRLEPLGRSERPVSAADIAGNRFSIVVRDLTRRQCDGLTAARRFLSVPGARGARTLRFVNYYGEQRFGSTRGGGGFAARLLIGGDFEGAMRLLIARPARKDVRARKEAKRAIAARWGAWASLRSALPASPERDAVERLAATGGDFRAAFSSLPRLVTQMAIESYQSYLWNEIARRLVAWRCAPPFIRVKGGSGELLFPSPAAAGPELAALEIPLPGPRATPGEPWGEVALGVLADEGIAPEDLRVPGLRVPWFGEAPRALFADALDFSLGPFEPDEGSAGARRFKRRVRFFLGRGSYGTVLLGALSGEPRGDASAEPQSVLR